MLQNKNRNCSQDTKPTFSHGHIRESSAISVGWAEHKRVQQRTQDSDPSKEIMKRGMVNDSTVSKTQLLKVSCPFGKIRFSKISSAGKPVIVPLVNLERTVLT